MKKDRENHTFESIQTIRILGILFPALFIDIPISIVALEQMNWFEFEYSLIKGILKTFIIPILLGMSYGFMEEDITKIKENSEILWIYMVVLMVYPIIMVEWKSCFVIIGAVLISYPPKLKKRHNLIWSHILTTMKETGIRYENEIEQLKHICVYMLFFYGVATLLILDVREYILTYNMFVFVRGIIYPLIIYGVYYNIDTRNKVISLIILLSLCIYLITVNAFLFIFLMAMTHTFKALQRK